MESSVLESIFRRDLKQLSPSLFSKWGARWPIQNLKRMWLRNWIYPHPLYTPFRGINGWNENEMKDTSGTYDGAYGIFSLNLNIRSYPHSAVNAEESLHLSSPPKRYLKVCSLRQFVLCAQKSGQAQVQLSPVPYKSKVRHWAIPLAALGIAYISSGKNA